MLTKKVVFGREVKVYKERPATIVEMFNHTVAKYPDQEALVKDGIRLSYQDLFDKVEAVSGNLKNEFGIQRGDRVALLLNNHIEFSIMVFACAKIGAIIVPLNTRLQERELSFMIGHSGSKLLVTEKEFREKVDAGLFKYGPIEKIFLIDEDSSEMAGAFYFPFSVLEKPGKMADVPHLNEEDPLFIMYTSGTTGVPKGAIGSHIGVIHSAINYHLIFQTNHETKTLIAVPLFHVTGLIGQLLHVVLVGGTSVLMKRYKTEDYIETLAKEQISFQFNVPTIYVMMMSHPLFHKYDYSFVQTIAYGGAPISNDTVTKLRKVFPNASLHNAYGATETSSPATVMPLSYPDSKIDSIGLPVPVADLKILDHDGRECKPNETGELLIKGPMVVEGYWDNPEANRNSFVDGYWRSGDMAMVDEDGFVYIMDRKKDMINRGGEKIFTIEVENVLYNHSAVLEAAVVGVPDEIYGEESIAFIVKKEGMNIGGEEIRSYLAGQLADYKVPKEVFFIDELPRNPGGKVLKTKLASTLEH